MPVQQKFCFTNSKGEDIYLFTLINKQGTLVSITNYGAIITAFKVKFPGGPYNDIVLGFDKVEDYLSENYLKHYAYFGAACGRYANRVKNGRFVLDEKEYQLSRNMGNDQLHGGNEGFDKKVWQLESVNESNIELKWLSPDGDEGFPGNLETLIKFELNDVDELTYKFVARTDKPTAVNLTHHSYFNLNNGEGLIRDHELRIPASTILQQDEGLVCNGEYVRVDNTKFDFRNFKRIGQDYDQCFIIDSKNEEINLVAEARSKHTGITMQIFSTEPAVQFYTGQGLHIPGGKKGNDYKPFSGFCLETQKHPNAINIAHFPNTVLRPGETYTQSTCYKLIQTDAK